MRARYVIPLLLFGAACPSFDGIELLCRRAADCASGQVCTSSGRCCAPAACGTAPGECGQQGDGCGGSLTCPCTIGECVGRGDEARCECTPKTCADLDARCGDLDDGCGGTVSCTCTAPDTCGAVTAGQCGCVPERCQPGACGEPDDACGGRLQCECAAPEVCGAIAAGRCDEPPQCANIDCGYVGDIDCGDCTDGALCGLVRPNSCQRPVACGASGATCGLLSESGSAVWCGYCSVNEACIDNNCAPSPRPFCWSEPREVGFVGNPRVTFVPDPVPRLYSSTSYFAREQGDTGCRRHGRVRVVGHGLVDTSSVVRLPTSALDHYGADMCRPPSNATCTGYAYTPYVRADGLEMFFSAAYPCADWWDPELFLATRPDLHSPWTAPVFRSSRSTFERDIEDGLSSPGLLPDRRTLLFIERATVDTPRDSRRVHLARRDSTTPGDTSFVRLMNPHPIESSHNEDGHAIGLVLLYGLSCDGTHLLFKREVHRDGVVHTEARRAAVLWPGPTFGPSEPYPHVSPGTHQARDSIAGFGETPDCRVLYISRRSGDVTYRLRQRCP